MSNSSAALPDHLVAMPLDFVPVAAIFDCDGTLADTMPLHYRAWRETLDPLGCPFPEEQFYAWGGVTAREIILRLNEQHEMRMDADRVSHEKEMNYRRLIPGVRGIEPVIAEARRLHGQCPLAVASGGMRPLVEETIRVLGLTELFPVVVGSGDVERGKPEPDVFLKAAERLGVEAAGCVVYEDAPAGLEAARRAGMRAVNVLLYLP
ncbi:MAG: HAD family phosphatase [Capsulimonadales bacterium]|nr:HAD family phosphatase [Capsulimonadales bacterium]